jgi:hypothetical protein
MAKKPQKEVVEDIIRNLVESEISGIELVAKDMGEKVKRLEEHSLRIKKYADEIEKLASEAAVDGYEKSSLEELVRNLEKTLIKLRKKQSENEPRSKVEAVKERPEPQVPETRKISLTGGQTGQKSRDDEEEKPKGPLYLTPEGFVVRKIRL